MFRIKIFRALDILVYNIFITQNFPCSVYVPVCPEVKEKIYKFMESSFIIRKNLLNTEVKKITCKHDESYRGRKLLSING